MFVSRDWRDPGEYWIKTEEGWEKKKVVQCGAPDSDEDLTGSHSDCEDEGHRSILVRRATNPDILREPPVSSPEIVRRRLNSASAIGQPHCHITLKSTREIAGFNGLSEALKRLDFRNAVWDVQRFHYICKLLDILISKKLRTLSGGAQTMLFVMIEEVARQVSESQQNLHILDQLLTKLRDHLENYLFWGTKLGSKKLWDQHSQRLKHIDSIATNIQITGPSNDEHPTIQDIPQECVRAILRRLDNHNDIKSAAEAYSVMNEISKEKSIWKGLCNFHWSQEQIEYIICTHKELQVKKEWSDIYHRLRRTYGLKENYSITLLLCRNCRCLYWESLGHPCIVDSNPDFRERVQAPPGETVIRVPPKAFLSYFSL